MNPLHHKYGVRNRFGYDDDSRTCPFCGLTSINWENEDAEAGTDAFECECGAWFYAAMPDEVTDDARRD